MMKQELITIGIDYFAFEKHHAPFFKEIYIALESNTLNFIQGKNGIGKSTLFRILQQGALPLEELKGSIHFGNSSYNLKETKQCPIFLLPQNYNHILAPLYSFKENLQCVSLNRFPLLQPLPVHTSLPSLLEKYGIDYEIPIERLSGGQKQILSILMALESSPKILLLDEPTGALDEENADLVMNFLKEICKEKNITMLLIVHNIEIIKKYGTSGYISLTKNSEGTRVAEHKNF